MEAITPSDDQAKAIRAIVDWFGDDSREEFYLAGFAGVGKSTIANLAIEEIKEQHNVSKVRTAAYTGKAASVLRKKGIEDASTIHSLIYTPKVDEETGELKFTLSEESAAAEADLIVLDECSMIDDRLADDLRSFGKKILVMGDPGQLPPVNGQGAFTRNVPDVFLHEIHRQSAESPIIELATLARQGLPIPRNYRKGDVEAMVLTKATQELIYRETTQPICGLNRVRWTYTQRMRARKGFSGEHPVAGERIICCRNNNKKGLFNGGMGQLVTRGADIIGVREIYSLTVDMDDLHGTTEDLLTDPYLFAHHFNEGKAQKIQGARPMLNEFDWGYIITAHKAQGSSWDHVTVIDDSGAFRDNRRNWLYTAITRAETGLTLLMRD
ncbi:ATP-dependent DNA helicase [Tautonia plasticadhaerens]|uniref:ATP-dependent RecD-like DNA helicase n=1 Tax=Tautonia plasticadhaerens TaxID=2527974 RepID=A0A518H275_9BACT|nr:AAA family ATPase [Tautonia plasticadhaerens]QDV34933.1 ATP-dependent RecD-like DNA helicase [Tautonia plasticadhaerens]